MYLSRQTLVNAAYKAKITPEARRLFLAMTNCERITSITEWDTEDDVPEVWYLELVNAQLLRWKEKAAGVICLDDRFWTDVCAQDNAAVDLVKEELQKAQARHQPMASPQEAFAVIQEELDEYRHEVKRRTPDRQAMRTELAQTAAMCLRALVDLNLVEPHHYPPIAPTPKLVKD